ncbi:MAG: nucleotidyltransferase domain-containing protein [Clostridia bacterium]|nr:nucleotidyltransferase domain-containing protein [Clostridia bacterium]
MYTIDEIRDIIVPIAKEYDLKTVYLFGSYARGEADAKSDVDIRLEGARCLRDELALCSIIPDTLGKEVDIVFTEDLRKSLDDPKVRFFVQHMRKSEVLLYERVSDQ